MSDINVTIVAATNASTSILNSDVISVEAGPGFVGGGVTALNVEAGANITVTTAMGSFTVIGRDVPVQSVQGRTGDVVLTRADITAAALSHTHSTTDIVGVTAIAALSSPVQSVQGRTGNVSLSVTDITAAPAVHTHSSSSITDLTATIQQYGKVVSVNGKTGTVSITITDLTAAAASHTHAYAAVSHTHSTSDIVNLTATIQQYGGGTNAGAVSSVNGKVGAVVLTVTDLTAAAASHTHAYAAVSHTHSTSDIVSLTATIQQYGGIGANDTVDGGFYGVTGSPVITISSQPSGQTASGGAATFSVTASVTQGATLLYQWQASTDSGATWSNISGATSSSLALTGLTSGDNGKRYRVVLSATGATSVTSSSATLTVSGGGGSSNVSTLLHFDGSGTAITDSSIAPKTYSAYGAATQSTAQSKWGGSSLYLQGSGDYIQAANDAAFNFGSGDFVVECWIRPDSAAIAAEYAIIMGQTANSYPGSGWGLWLAGGKVLFTSNAGNFHNSDVSVNANEWTYIAVSRWETVLSIYVGGVRQYALSNVATSDASTPLQIGRLSSASWDSPWQYTGYIDDIRITKGSNRGYTGLTIPVPTEAFANS